MRIRTDDQVLRQDTGQCDAVGAHAADDDEEEIQSDVQNARDEQIKQGAAGIARSAQNGIAKVIERHGGHAEEIDAQVDRRAVDQLFLCAEQFQQRNGRQLAEQQEHRAEDEAQGKGRMDGALRLLTTACAEKACNKGIDTAAKANEKTRKQGNERRCGSDCAECDRAGETAYDGDVRHIEQDLQNIRQHQRQAEGKDLLPEPAMRQAARLLSFPWYLLQSS